MTLSEPGDLQVNRGEGSQRLLILGVVSEDNGAAIPQTKSGIAGGTGHHSVGALGSLKVYCRGLGKWPWGLRHCGIICGCLRGPSWPLPAWGWSSKGGGWRSKGSAPAPSFSCLLTRTIKYKDINNHALTPLSPVP